MIEMQNTIIHRRILQQTDFKVIPMNPSPGIPAMCVYNQFPPLECEQDM